MSVGSVGTSVAAGADGDERDRRGFLWRVYALAKAGKETLNLASFQFALAICVGGGSIGRFEECSRKFRKPKEN